VIRAVGYEGGEQYLGRWRDVLEDECKIRGWHFVINPSSLAFLDIVVAVRAQDGYAPKTWKSNVKLANAQGTGTPCILNRERGYLEKLNGSGFWADNRTELSVMLEALRPHCVRAKFSHELLTQAPLLPDVAARYRAWLEQLNF